MSKEFKRTYEIQGEARDGLQLSFSPSRLITIPLYEGLNENERTTPNGERIRIVDEEILPYTTKSLDQTQ